MLFRFSRFRHPVAQAALFVLTVTILSLAGLYIYHFRATPYEPIQPVSFSHRAHVETLGMDCEACHWGVHDSSRAGVPPANWCMNCHQHILADSPLIEPLRRAADPHVPGYTGQPIPWVMVNRTAAHVHFNHAAHVNRGVGCSDCHGAVASMERVRIEQNRGMRWCMECHRDPDSHLRPLEEVTNPSYHANLYLQTHAIKRPDGTRIERAHELGAFLREQWQVRPPLDCTACHH